MQVSAASVSRCSPVNVDGSTTFEVCHEGDNTQIQESVDMVGILTNQNDMRLNSGKCKEMIIDFSRNYSLTSVP